MTQKETKQPLLHAKNACKNVENWLYLECFLKVVVFLQEHAIVDDDLWCSDAQVQDTVVHSFA